MRKPNSLGQFSAGLSRGLGRDSGLSPSKIAPIFCLNPVATASSDSPRSIDIHEKIRVVSKALNTGEADHHSRPLASSPNPFDNSKP